MVNLKGMKAVQIMKMPMAGLLKSVGNAGYLQNFRNIIKEYCQAFTDSGPGGSLYFKGILLSVMDL